MLTLGRRIDSMIKYRDVLLDLTGVVRERYNSRSWKY